MNVDTQPAAQASLVKPESSAVPDRDTSSAETSLSAPRLTTDIMGVVEAKEEPKVSGLGDAPIPTTTVRRASITFKLKNYNDHHDNVPPSNSSDLLGPHWAGARLSRASSPALSVQSESSDRALSSKNSGTRPATFLFTLTTFLRENPKSPYMRWSDDGTYFIVPDKAGLMERVIPDLFNQNSYSSFARQLNIYGWRRLQASPDGKVTSGSCTIWKHDQITRETLDEDLKHVKRNAQDKSRRNSKSIDDEEDEYPAIVNRPRRAVTMSSTTAAEAMAARAAMSTASTNLRYSSTTFDERKRPVDSSGSSSSPPQIPSVLAPVPTRARSPLPGVPAAQASQPPTFIQGRMSRPLPMRRPPARTFSYSGRTMRKRNHDTSIEITESETSDSTESDGDLVTVSALNAKPAMHAAPVVDNTQDNRQVKRLRSVTNPEIPPSAPVAHRRDLSNESALRILPFQVAASRQVMPQNPVDVYIACVEGTKGGPPAFKGRDRLDIPIWVDDFSQARFVLAGEVMRAWALWDIVPENALIYIALSDGGKPPRPLGIAQQLKENTANGDPNRAYSRERIYLETSSEPGCVGQCCLVFRKTTPEEEEQATKAVSKGISQLAQSSSSASMKSLPDVLPWSGAVPIPPTPKIQILATTSSERRPLLCETKSGRKVSDRFLDSPGGLQSPSLLATAVRTPKTADAISSLAAMQAFARSFTPMPPQSASNSGGSAVMKDADMKPAADLESTIPRSLENLDTKAVISSETQIAAGISAGSS